MTRFLALILALFATAAIAQTKGTPTFQIDKSGIARCLYAWDLNNTTATDKGLPFGCIDAKGAWNLPPALRNTKEITETDLRGYGYIGDGASHPLSGVTSLNGRSTAGWTLGQWQAVLPSAVALSDEIDGTVINSVIQTATSDVTIKLGPGTARFSRPIRSCAVGVTIRGAGETRTILRFNAGSNGWNHCATSPETAGTTRINAYDIRLLQATPGNTTVGINAKYVAGSIGGYFDNVKIDNFNDTAIFDNGGGITINRVWGDSGVTAGTASVGNGITFHGEITFVNHVTNSMMARYDTAYVFQAKSASGLEDMAVINSGAGETNTCIKVGSDDPNYSPLQYLISNFACQSYGAFVEAKQASHIAVDGGTWLIEQPTGSWSASGRDMFAFCRVTGGYITGAWISNNQNALSSRSVVHVGPFGGCTDGANVIRVEKNRIEVNNWTVTQAYLWKESNASGVVFKDNTFTSAFIPQVPPPNNAVSWAADATSAIVRATPGEIKTFSGNVTGIGSVVATNVATVSLPPGVWSCSSNMLWTPTAGTITVLQAGYNTVSATMPSTPANGSVSEGGSWTGGVSKALPTYSFDFSTATSNTNVYMVGLALYSGGSLNMSSGGQCIRLR